MKTRIALILILTLGLAAPALAASEGAVTRDDLEGARQRNREISASLEATDVRYEGAIADEIRIRESLHGLATRVTETEQRRAILRLAAEDVVRESYMTAGSDGAVTTVLGSTSFTDIPVRAAYLQAANDQDLRIIDEMLAVEVEYRSRVGDLDDALELQRHLVVEIEDLAVQLLDELDVANAEYRRLEATWQKQEEERKQREAEEQRLRELEEERKRREAEATAAAEEAIRAATSSTTSTAVRPAEGVAATTTTTTAPAPTTATALPESTGTTPTVPAEPIDSTTTTTTEPVSTTTTTVPVPASASRVCPVDGAASFSDTWGAPRSGGRIHKGVDMSASRGTPVVAIESGRIYRLSNSSLGGISLYLLGDSADMYYYAHLDAWAEGLAGGQKVAPGDPVGVVGTTGNSPSWAPHLHFGWQPGGGDWANPYPMVTSLCR